MYETQKRAVIETAVKIREYGLIALADSTNNIDFLTPLFLANARNPMQFRESAQMLLFCRRGLMH